ncbi:peptidoglycan/LPS O-acetylase OafA/YrhL [Salinibacter ruber]|nr:peptidoglycan/LPS O-acetylase OafA/YrhL [Salinibacter ruber]
MTETTRNRLLGLLLLLVGAAGILLMSGVSPGGGKLPWFLAGCCQGLGAVLLLTGTPPWHSARWRASWQPLRPPN